MSEDDFKQDSVAEAELAPEEAKKKKTRKILIIVFAIILPIVIVVGLAIFFILALVGAFETCMIGCCNNCGQSCSDSCASSCSDSCSCGSNAIKFGEHFKAQLEIIKWAFLYLFQI